MEIIYYLIGIPFIAGLLCLLLPDRMRTLIWGIAFDVCFVLFVVFLYLFSDPPSPVERWFLWDNLTNLTLLGIGFFGLVIATYSYKFINNFINRYYAYLLWTLAAAIGAVVSNNLILMAVFWGILAITLYLMVGLGGPDASYPAKKTFIIVGGSDSFLILGIALLWVLTGCINITDINLQIDRWLGACAFLCFICASFAKAGVMPLHTWIPEISESVPVPVIAFLPASLDKLLGIYLLARVCLNLFSYHESLWFLLRLVGAITIIGAVFLALIQHNMKKLLAYHAVSQVGYMVVGIASGNPIGICGGLFHMINNAIYKCCLFLGAGSVEKQSGSTDLDNLGGLAKNLPLTFLSFMFASFAISGIPPFNGFFSKWMIYQGLIEGSKNGEPSWILWIIMALIGSGLTLASFMKIIHAVFLGRHSDTIKTKDIKESHWTMVFPMVVLAILCLIFGVFFIRIPLFRLLIPVVPSIDIENIFTLILPLALLIAGIILGLLFYPLTVPKKRRIAEPFIGGEVQSEDMRPSGTEFYNTVKDLKFLRSMYHAAERKTLDLYEVCKSITMYFSEGFRSLHSGILGTYLTWILFGLITLLYVFLRW
ncbi:MAG TPA: proton-conducting transporter membrane subunit [Candidatus Ratteibacteria bacterium]|nr:proton-conducting transporter membrane subunit [bacterium]HRS05742.1 proton-conducting transporter membrane subunit [Candidatus Ratteibacteria bacterium]HRV03490.1 proton-conducting transporter membrane subunit [Candidatus Ratteibacteria bacterium]